MKTLLFFHPHFIITFFRKTINLSAIQGPLLRSFVPLTRSLPCFSDSLKVDKNALL